MSRIGVVLLNYNDYELTIKLLQQLKQFNCVESICVVDNYSQDESYMHLKKYESSKCHIIRTKKNSGYASGNNVGCRYLTDNLLADIIFIMNSDVCIEEMDFIKIIRAFECNSEYMILSGVMYNSNGNIADRPFLRIPSFWEDVFLCFYLYNCIYKRSHSYAVDMKMKVIPVDAVPGSLWAVRVDALKAINFLDEGTFLYFEEFTTAMRLREYNHEWKVGIVTDASYIHNHSTTIKKNIMEFEVFKIYMDSKMYFETRYHKIFGIRKTILFMAEKIALLEEKLFLMMRK